MKVLVTGTAGFIGFHLVSKLLENSFEIIGLDNINDYYDVNLKLGRLEEHGISKEKIGYNVIVNSSKKSNYKFIKLNLEDLDNLKILFEKEKFDYVVNLAAQAGVRYSITNPHTYLHSNIEGFLNILECCRHNEIKHLVYASSSSVYGLNQKYPFSTHDNVDHPISLYAASKKANELMAHSYSYLYGLSVSGLRFFSAYGPWGRPDMALFHFTKSIYENKTIEVYNNGQMERDFTYVDDIVNGVQKVINTIPKPNPDWSPLKPDPSSSVVPYKLYNIGRSEPVLLMDFIKCLESEIGKKADIIYKPMQAGDIPMNWADSSELINELGYTPKVSVKEGIKNFVNWYKSYYKQS